MTGLNIEWARGELKKLINMTDPVSYSSPNVISIHYRGDAAVSVLARWVDDATVEAAS